MSERNGDRARADRKRKARINHKLRIRKFRKVLQDAVIPSVNK